MQPSNPLLEELQWVHAMLRRDLRTCQQLADAALNGGPAGEIRAELGQLRARGPLFQLRVNCLRYCSFVHAHHGGEDVMLFPAVRRAAPELAAVVDRLEADHRAVSALLDEVEAAARVLDDDVAVRTRLADALTTLSAQLLEHLDLEEKTLAPVLQTWNHWPFHG